MLRPRRQYRILQTAFIFALIGIAFFGAYAGYRASEYIPNPRPQYHAHEAGYIVAWWHWVTHDAAGFFTLVLSVITAVLAAATYGLYVATASLARDTREASAAALVASTEATNLARQEFNATHRPRIKVHAITFERQKPDGSIDDEIIVGKVFYVNFGEREAIIDSIRYRFGQRRIPLESGIDMPGNAQVPDVPIKGGMRGWFGVSAEELVKTAKISSDEYSGFFFMGQIFYREAQSDSVIRELGFCRILECGPQGCRWKNHDNPEYEYSY